MTVNGGKIRSALLQFSIRNGWSLKAARLCLPRHLASPAKLRTARPKLLPFLSDERDYLITGRSAEAGLDLTLSVSESVTKTQISHLETSNADSAQSKDVWNGNLEFLRSSADCLLSADCL